MNHLVTNLSPEGCRGRTLPSVLWACPHSQVTKTWVNSPLATPGTPLAYKAPAPACSTNAGRWVWDQPGVKARRAPHSALAARLTLLLGLPPTTTNQRAILTVPAGLGRLRHRGLCPSAGLHALCTPRTRARGWGAEAARGLRAERSSELVMGTPGFAWGTSTDRHTRTLSLKQTQTVEGLGFFFYQLIVFLTQVNGFA